MLLLLLHARRQVPYLSTQVRAKTIQKRTRSDHGAGKITHDSNQGQTNEAP